MSSTSRSLSLLVFLLALAGCDELATRFGGGPLAVVVSDARGLSSGDQVRVHGVNVGRVSAVSVLDEGARIEMELTTDVVLHADACGAVRPDGLVGEAYLHVDLGEADGPLEGPLTGCQEPSLEGATAESLAELAGLLTDLRRYVGALERGERALCTMPTPTTATPTTPTPEPQVSPDPLPAPDATAQPEAAAPGATDATDAP